MSRPLNRQAVASFVLVALIVSSTGFVLFMKTSPETGQDLYRAGMREFESSNFGTASSLFNRSYQMHEAAGEHELARQSFDWKLRADRVLLEFCLDREQAEAALAERYPWVPEDERNAWLDDPTIERIVSDGKELFFDSIVDNVAFRNLTLYHQAHDGHGTDVLATMMKEILEEDADRTGTYFNPVDYLANGTLTLPRDLLPATGTLSVWIPAPIKTASQTDVVVLKAEPQEWVRSFTRPAADIGYVYLEVPLDDLTDDVVVTVSYSLTSWQKHFDIDPSAVGEYDRSSADYATYTASHDNILITPEIIAEAKAVVGEETNPYLQAKLLYDYVVGNITYSYTPHLSLDAQSIAESEYVRTHRYGDCGAQSMYYCALLRSLGVPARSDGGYQTFGGGTGSHFWAEFYLPNYGWVPVDVTAADAIDWIWEENATPEERARYKDYYFGNLDNLRYVIQNDVDERLTPLPGTPMPLSAAFQSPVASCLNSDQDVPVMAMIYWEFVITRVP